MHINIFISSELYFLIVSLIILYVVFVNNVKCNISSFFIFIPVKYSDLSLDIYNRPFIESKAVPSDSEIISYTWKYVNKSGGPDSRFKDNKKIPVCNYGNIQVRSDQGLDTHIQYSNPNL